MPENETEVFERVGRVTGWRAQAELQDMGEYLAAVGRAMELIATAFDEVLMAREKAKGLRALDE